MSQPPEGKRLIAVVDSDPAVRHSLEFSLRTEGYEVASFTLAEDLVAVLQPDMLLCLVCEYRLPGITGLDLLAKVRKIQNDVPVIMLVTHPDRALERRIKAEHAAIIEKPLMGDSLIERIQELTGR